MANDRMHSNVIQPKSIKVASIYLGVHKINNGMKSS